MIHFSNLPESTDGFTGATDFFDFDSPEVRSFVDEAIVGATDQRERAVRLFYAVRDKIRYDPYRISADANDYRASQVINAGHGWCISKAGLLAACARRIGIPSAVGLADVVNHLTSEKLRKQMGGLNVFYDHGYTALYIDGQWLKAVPAFNIELCTRFAVVPTEFDGTADALYQPYDALQRLHMEYLADHGTFSDLPLQRVLDDLDRHYPSIVKRGVSVDASERFENDAHR